MQEQIVLNYKAYKIMLSAFTIEVYQRDNNLDLNSVWGPEILTMDAIQRAKIFIDQECEKYELW